MAHRTLLSKGQLNQVLVCHKPVFDSDLSGGLGVCVSWASSNASLPNFGFGMPLPLAKFPVRNDRVTKQNHDGTILTNMNNMGMSPVSFWGVVPLFGGLKGDQKRNHHFFWRIPQQKADL